MTNTNLVHAMGRIDPKLIADAAPDVAQKKPANKTWVKWASLAACFAVAIIIAVPFIGNHGLDNLSEYKAYIFSSYDEFDTVVPDIQIIENLANMDDVDVTIYGVFINTAIEDSTKIENYAWFDVEAKRGEEFVATVQLKLNDNDSADVYVRNHSLINETTIDGVQVFYAYNADMEYWDSVLDVGGNYYNIHSYASDEESFLEFLAMVIGNKNQILSLSFTLNGKVHSYNIEYDSDGIISKIDNTDYYEFLEDGELITDVHILDTELTDYFLKNGGQISTSANDDKEHNGEQISTSGNNDSQNDISAGKKLFAINEINGTINAAPKYRAPTLHYNEIWDLVKAIDYLGIDIPNAVTSLPDELGLEYIESNGFTVLYENGGTLVEDRMCYEFAGKDGAKVMVLASKLRTPYDCLYSSDTDEVTNIRIPETDEVIPVLVYAQNKSEATMDYELYVADFEYNGIYYRIHVEHIRAYNLDSLIREIVK